MVSPQAILLDSLYSLKMVFLGLYRRFLWGFKEYLSGGLDPQELEGELNCNF